MVKKPSGVDSDDLALVFRNAKKIDLDSKVAPKIEFIDL